MSDIAFLGTDAGAAQCLRELATHIGVGLVVTPPARRRGRRGTSTPTPVAEAAAELGIATLETADINAPESVLRLEDAAPRLLVVVAFGQILRRAVRGVPPLGSLNLHFSLLPRWRGAAPVQRAILAGDAETGACVQRLVARLDAGDVLAVVREPIRDDDDSPALRGRLVASGAPLLADVTARVLAGNAPEAVVQDEAQVTLAAMIRSDEGALDPTLESAVELDRRIRALDEWPGCRAVIERESGARQAVLVRSAHPGTAADPADEEARTAVPGSIVGAGPDGLRVACRDGVLCVTSLQKPGKRAVSARDFLNGFPVAVGDRLLPPA